MLSHACIIYREQLEDVNATVKKHVMASFLLLVRYSHGMFRQGKDFFREDLSKWHGLPRKGLIRTGFPDTYDVKWRGFVQNQRFNVDQSPISFTTDNNHT